MKRSNQQLSRRRFLKRAALGTTASCSALATLSRFQLAQAALNADSDYKALVCVFLFGGNDSYNMLPPLSSNVHQTYLDTRQALAVPRDQLIPVSGLSQSGTEYGLHPELAALKPLYESKELGVVANMGALLEPVTRETFLNKSARVPGQLFSHNTQQEFVMSCSGGAEPTSGWAARMTDALAAANTDLSFPLHISLNGSNPLQSSSSVLPYAMTANGATRLAGMDIKASAESDYNALRRAQIYDQLLKQDYDHLFLKEYTRVSQRAWQLADSISDALDGSGGLTTAPPAENKLAADLQMVAQMIKARSAFGVKRQTFFVGLGGFDTHANQERDQPGLFKAVSEGLSYFAGALKEIGMFNQVTTFTASDFGRTLTSNGDGSDHGWGGHQLVMGGAVKGGTIYGQMPDFSIGNNMDSGEGRIIPGISMEQYAATLARWMGVGAADIANVLPALAAFSETDLGFLNVTASS